MKILTLGPVMSSTSPSLKDMSHSVSIGVTNVGLT